MVHLPLALAALATLLVGGTVAQQPPLTDAVSREPPRAWESLSGRTEDEIQVFIQSMGPRIVGAKPPPKPVEDVSMKLVNDKDHEFREPRATDARGPCPGMNSLANHGYISRTGVAEPAEMVTAVQEAYNMGWNIGTFITYASLLVEGNPLTNLLSIGRHSDLTGPNPEGFPKALVGGIATHGPFEGDTSQSRADFYWGDNVAFNESIFDQFLETCDRYDGLYNITSASEMRSQRYWHSRNTNPTFTFDVPRYVTAYAETTFPLAYFNDGRRERQGLAADCRQMRSFYEYGRMPEGFHRREGSAGMTEVANLITEFKKLNRLKAGRNIGLGNFVEAYPEVQGLVDADGNCAMYRYFISTTLDLYPNPTGILLESLRQNAHNMYVPLTGDPLCPELFPYGYVDYGY
ncbi:heme-thiolate peroxidase [Auriculariales sp. MPI-PUGE-AT-0066]|nr:heme-thiolate peroxidase [Auriculariales sp. MPI-PUGE-AT-0066]